MAEIRQMVGRAGRRHGGSSCEAYVLVDEEDLDEVASGMAGDAKFEVSSSMMSCDDLVFHVLAELCSGGVSDVAEAKAWYSRSFGARLAGRPSFEKVFERLEGCGAAERTPLGWVPTKEAYVAAELYFHPADVKAWGDGFAELFELGLEKDDAAVAWALGSAPETEAPGDFGRHRFVMSMFRDALPAGLVAEPGTVAKGTLWWSALGGPSVGRMRNRVLELRRDFGRVARALGRLDDIREWGMRRYFGRLEERVRKGVPEVLAELCRIPGVTKGRAEFLYNAGIRDRAGIRDEAESFDGEVDEGFMSVLREVASGLR